MSDYRTLEEYAVKRIEMLEKENAELKKLTDTLMRKDGAAEMFKENIKKYIHLTQGGYVTLDLIGPTDKEYRFVTAYMGIETGGNHDGE